jgi:hypothetical protein
MSEPVPAYAQEAYAVLCAKFGYQSFRPDTLSWFISNSMTKKTLHVLERAGWIDRVDKGQYTCVDAREIFKSMVAFRVPELLSESGIKYSYTDASAVEIWTDNSYIQRSWEHSPYYIEVLREDLGRWIEYFRQHRIKVFVSKAGYSLGEFVILEPRKRLSDANHNGLPVDPLNMVVNFCEANIDSFEYPLAYLKAKFSIATKVEVDQRVLAEAARAVS